MGSSQLSMANLLIHHLSMAPSPPRIRFRDQLRWGRSRDGTCGFWKMFWKNWVILEVTNFFCVIFEEQKNWMTNFFGNHHDHCCLEIIIKNDHCLDKLLTSKQQNNGHFWWWFHRNSAIWNEGQMIQMMVSQPKKPRKLEQFMFNQAHLMWI